MALSCYCPTCGSLLDPRVVFCGRCGRRISGPANLEAIRNLQRGGLDKFVKRTRIPHNDQLAIAEFVMVSVRRLGEIQQSRRGEVFHGGRQVRQYRYDFPP